MLKTILSAVATAMMGFACGMSTFMAVNCKAGDGDKKDFQEYILHAIFFCAIGITNLILLVRR